MAGAANAVAYDGRDDAEAESIEFCVEMELARLHATVQHEQPARAAAIARFLRAYAVRFEEAAKGRAVAATQTAPHKGAGEAARDRLVA